MANMFVIFVVAIFELLSFTETEAYDVCYPDYTYSYTTSKVCYGDNEYCCNSDYDCCTVLATGAIIGIVFGCLFGIGMVITFICICVQKNKRHPGVVVQPNQQAAVSYVSYNGQQQYGQNPYGQQQYSAPQQYSQQQLMAPPPYQTVQFTHPPAQPPLDNSQPAK